MTSKGQVTVPKQVREALGLENGDYLVFEPKGERIEVRKAPVSPTEDFEALADRIAERFKDRGITAADVAKAISWARNKS